jgi:hypothetical protein
MSLDDEPTIQSDAFLHEIEMIMKILQMPSRYEEPFACPVCIALWEEYRRRMPDGLKVPPIDLMDCTDPELQPYAEHVDSCDDCNEV